MNYSRNHMLEPFFRIAVPTIVISFLMVAGLRIALICSLHPDLGGIEPNETYILQRHLSGYPVYTDPEHPPFSITQKTPLYYKFVGFIGSSIGMDGESPTLVMVLNRSMAFIFNLLTVVLIFVILKNCIGVSFASAVILSGLVFLCFEMPTYGRPDSLYSFCFLLGIYFFLVHIKSSENGLTIFLVLSWTVAVLSVFIKQSGIILPLIFMFHHLRERQLRSLLGGITIGLFAFVLLFVFSAGGAYKIFLKNVVQGLDNGVNFKWYYNYILQLSFYKFSVLIFLGFFFIIEGFKKEKSSVLIRFLGLALAGTLAFALTTGLKYGSTPSYFTEFNNLTLISAPVFLAHFFTVDGRQTKSTRLVPILFLVLFLSLLSVQATQKHLLEPLTQDFREWHRECQEVRDQLVPLLSSNDYVMTDDPLLKLYLFRYCLFPQDDIVSCCAFPLGVFNYDRFTEIVRSGRLRFIIRQSNQWSSQLFDVDSNNYQLKEELGKFRILEYVGYH